MGLSVACEVARRGRHVTVVERGDHVATESSWAAAGMLSPLGEAVTGGPMLAFGLESLALYRDWVAEVEGRSGMSVDYGRPGKLQVAMSPSEVQPLRSLLGLGAAAGVKCRWLDAAELRALAPAVTPAAEGALYIEEDGAVDNRLLGPAVARACEKLGVLVRTGTAVTRILGEGGSATGVLLDDGETIAAGAVLVAAGAWSGGLEGIPRSLPVRPVRGQMLALRPPRPPSSRVVGHGHVYVVPRSDGRVLLGATMEEVGFEKQTTHEGIAELVDGATEIFPSLASARVVERWSGLRPGTPDGLPLLGTDPDVENLFYATGHFRNGILLAPATARAIAELLETGSSRILPREFHPDRFDASGMERTQGRPQRGDISQAPATEGP